MGGGSLGGVGAFPVNSGFEVFPTFTYSEMLFPPRLGAGKSARMHLRPHRERHACTAQTKTFLSTFIWFFERREVVDTKQLSAGYLTSVSSFYLMLTLYQCVTFPGAREQKMINKTARCDSEAGAASTCCYRQAKPPQM